MATSTLINNNTPASPVEVTSGTLHITGTWGGATVLVLAGTAADNGERVGILTEHDESHVHNLRFEEVMHVSAALANAGPDTALTLRLVHP